MVRTIFSLLHSSNVFKKHTNQAKMKTPSRNLTDDRAFCYPLRRPLAPKCISSICQIQMSYPFSQGAGLELLDVPLNLVTPHVLGLNRGGKIHLKMHEGRGFVPCVSSLCPNCKCQLRLGSRSTLCQYPLCNFLKSVTCLGQHAPPPQFGPPAC